MSCENMGQISVDYMARLYEFVFKFLETKKKLW